MTIENGYNILSALPQMQYQIIAFLMQSPDANPLWNLLYYNTPDALDLPILTLEQKGKLIYDGSPDSTKFRIFFNSVDDAFTEMCSLLKIYPEIIVPKNRVVSNITFRIEIFSHFKIATLNNYTTRNVTMLQNVLLNLNGMEIPGGVGLLSFDQMGNPYDRANLNISNSRSFEGYSLYMSTRTA